MYQLQKKITLNPAKIQVLYIACTHVQNNRLQNYKLCDNLVITEKNTRFLLMIILNCSLTELGLLVFALVRKCEKDMIVD
jgi:hypothetical protein